MKKLKTIALVIVSCLVLTGCGCQKEAEKYTVSFNSNGGSAVVNQVVEDGKTVSKPADPTREGYTFAGWYTSEDATQAYDFSKGVTGNLTLTARWTKGSVSEVCTKTCGTGYTLQNPDSKDCKCVKNSTNTTPSNNTGKTTNNNSGKTNNSGTSTKPTPKPTPTPSTDPTPTTDPEPTPVVETYTYENKGTPSGFADVQVGIAVYDGNGNLVVAEELDDANGNYLGEYDASTKMVVVNKNYVSKIAKVVIGGKTYDIKQK